MSNAEARDKELMTGVSSAQSVSSTKKESSIFLSNPRCYYYAGWLIVLVLLSSLPHQLLSLFHITLPSGARWISDVQGIFACGATIVVLTFFRGVVHNLAQFYKADVGLALMKLSAAAGAIEPLSQLFFFSVPDFFFFLVYVLDAVASILAGKYILKCKNDLLTLRNQIAYLLVAYGSCLLVTILIPIKQSVVLFGVITVLLHYFFWITTARLFFSVSKNK